jgi:nitrite reductase (cytochrome c-552)
MNEREPSRDQPRGGKGRTLLLVAIAAAVAAAATAALLVNIFERKQEARTPFFRVVALDETTTDPELWGKNFPSQYDGWKSTVDQQRTRFGGSEAVPRTPTEADPRSIVAQSRLEEDPRLRTFWAGYAFSQDFNEERGHAYMLLDQRLSGRQRVVQQPGACVHCHASVVGLYRELGDGDLQRGFDAVNAMTYQEVTQQVEHPVACIDCHDPATMALRVTRPAFMKGIREVKAAQGVADFDVNRDATRFEMRAYVCGQCHVEYYFRGAEKTLTFPWRDGLQADQILAYYDREGFADWTHAHSGARTLKAQHPEFEMWSQGSHARAGVACPDCHMPFRRIGGFKVSDHQVRSPLLMVAAACQTCHKASEAELIERATTIQEKTFAMRNLGMDAVVALIADIERAKNGGASEAALAPARAYHRRAQFLLDFVEAENSMGFHADQEAMRVLGLALDAARLGQVAVRDPGAVPAMPVGAPAPPAGGPPDAAPATAAAGPAEATR